MQMASLLKTQGHGILWLVIYTFILRYFLFFVASETLGSIMTLNTTLKANQTQTLISPNGIFEVGFHTKNHSNGYTLAIWYANIPIKTIVWMADTSMNLSNNAYLFLSREGELQVYDGSSMLTVWTSHTTKLNVIGVRILDTGNFVIFNKTNNVWQSFDSPKDTLLPMQDLKRKDNVTMYTLKTEGPWIGTKYIMGWINDYIRVTWDSSYCSAKDQPYYWNSNSTTPSTQLMFSHVVLTTEGEFMAVYENSTDYVLIFESNDVRLSGRLRRLTLDYDGNLRMYSWYIGSSTKWTVEWKAVSDVCNIFGFCGPFAWCDSGLCYCPKGFLPIDPANTFLGCEPTNSLICNDTKHVDDMIDLQSIDYPYGIADYAEHVNIKEEDCIAKCLAFCLCQAVTISRTSTESVTSCWLKKGILINGHHDESKITYLKVGPKNSRKRSLSREFILTLVIFILGPMVIILGFISSIFGYTFICKKIKVYQLKKLEIKWITTTHGTLVKLSSKEIILMTNNFAEEIGKGGYGTVFKGEIGCDITTKQIVAVKRLDKLEVGEKEFINEVDIIGHIHHANLVHLLGYCAEQHQRMFIYEYMEQHSLDKILFQNKKPKAFVLDWRIRFNIACQTAKGLAYLHNDVREQRIIHCDIKPENILLDSMFCAKVADFGMSRIMNREQTCTVTRQIRGTFGYLAPEWTCDQMSITTKTDVYSYGMVLLEIVGGRRNLKPTTSTNTDDLNSDWYFPLWAYSKINTIETMFEVLDPLLYGLANPLELERALRVAFWCINDRPHLRPSMSMVVQMLEGHMPIELPVPQPDFLLDMVTSSKDEDDDLDIYKMFTTSIETSEASGEQSCR